MKRSSLIDPAVSRDWLPVHIVHLSSGDALRMIRDAKKRRPADHRGDLSALPHIRCGRNSDGATQFKCCPPVRERENREKLWKALADGTIDMVVSDHSPCTPALKLQESGDFLEAWGEFLLCSSACR